MDREDLLESGLPQTFNLQVFIGEKKWSAIKQGMPAYDKGGISSQDDKEGLFK